MVPARLFFKFKLKQIEYYIMCLVISRIKQFNTSDGKESFWNKLVCNCRTKSKDFSFFRYENHLFMIQIFWTTSDRLYITHSLALRWHNSTNLKYFNSNYPQLRRSFSDLKVNIIRIHVTIHLQNIWSATFSKF